MTLSMPFRKPEIRRFGGVWYCTNNGVAVGRGPSPAIAYKEWSRIQTVMNRWHNCGNEWDWNR